MRIAIVNDSAMAAEALRRVLTTVPEHQIVWIARNGREAVELCARDTPDLVLMDLIMPVMGGVEATRRIMHATPCSILIVTVSVRTNAEQVFEAMGYGALDAIDTPSLGSGNLSSGATRLLSKIENIGRFIRGGNKIGAAGRKDHARQSSVDWVVAIGASAGGPKALSTLLSRLPATFPAAIVIVQHVDERFASGMAKWLDEASAIPVRVAVDGDNPRPGTALLAGTGDHLAFRAGGRLGYVREPADYAYRPSIDVFFQSVVRCWPGKAVGVLLTGMGTDGAQGLKALRTAGHYTIAQDKDTSAVYGMPKAAAAIDAAVDILPLDRISGRLADALLSPALRRKTLP